MENPIEKAKKALKKQNKPTYKRPKKIRKPDFGCVYDKIKVPKVDRPRHYNEEKEMKIKMPFRMIVAGATGSAKTQYVRNFIEHITFFTKYYFFVKMTDEPLYLDMIKRLEDAGKMLKKECVEVYTSLDKLSEIKFNKKENNLCIFDDMVNSSKSSQATVGDLWIAGRKLNISAIWITQNYFDTNIQLRRNTNLIALKYCMDREDLRRILRRSGIASEYNSHQIGTLASDVIENHHKTLLIDSTPFQEKDYQLRADVSPINLQTYFKEKEGVIVL